MSIRLCVHPAQMRRPTYQQRSHSLIKVSEPPQSTVTHENICEAIGADGQQCKLVLSSEEQHWCQRHGKDLEDLNMAWEKTEKEAEKIEVWDATSATQKVIKLQLAVSLRRRLRERFHTRGVDTVDYTGWIAKIERDIKGLADAMLLSHVKIRQPTLDTPQPSTSYTDEEQFQNMMVLHSPLSPRVPVSSLQAMQGGGTILVLKRFQNDLCEESMRRLYSIVPDLDDSARKSDSPILTQTDLGADIVRAWFRIMILHDSEAEVLEHASKSRSIDDFLRGCQASQLEMYCDYFQNAWRPHAVQYLRVAICAQTLAGGDKKMIRLLGGIIPSSTEGFSMTKPAWDILYRWFPTLLNPSTIASICSNFEDYTTICQLLILGLYHENWYDPESVLSECSTGVSMGFVPMSKGDHFSDALVTHERRVHVQSESRNWFCGQMAMGDSLTLDFLQELQRRTDRFFLVVYEGTSANAAVHPKELDLFITRSRSATTREGLHDAEWTTSLTLEDIKNQLRMRKISMYDPMLVDSWQFIIIDRHVGQPFELIDIVQDVLLMLVGDPTPRQIAKRVVRGVIPPSRQERILEEMTIDSTSELRYSPPHDVQYDGNRFRCHDPDHNFVVAQQSQAASQKLTRDERRFIGRVCEDMERCGIVSLVTEHVKPQTRPVIIPGADGALDLYFPYERTDPKNGSELPFPFPLTPTNALLKFANSWKQQYPDGIMAKGSIQTHYCAWPMPVMRSLGSTGSNFATPEGHIYQWNAMPFDRPWSAHAWQYYMQHHINNKFPFVMFYLSSFVICAVDEEDAERKIETLLEETEDRGWRVSIPKIRNWKFHVADLKLDKLHSGIRPADES